MSFTIRRFFFFLACLVGGLVSPAAASFPVVRTYDPTTEGNPVDQSATTLTVGAFQNSVGTAFDQNRGGVINFDTGTIDVPNVLRANYGLNRAVDFTKLPGGTGNWSRTNITNGGISGTPSSQGVLFGGAADFLLGGVFDPITNLAINERITQFGVTIIDRNDQPLPIVVTASYYNFVTGTPGDLPTVNFTIAQGGSNQFDTFFGFTAPADSYLTRVNFSSTSGGIAYDDLGFVTSTVPEPGTWALGAGLLFAGVAYRRRKRSGDNSELHG